MPRSGCQLGVRDPQPLLLLPIFARAHRHNAILRTISVDTSDVLADESRLAPRAASGIRDFNLDVVPIQLTASTHGVSSTAVIDLTQVDAPYMDHGAISWLSNDTRVFKLQPNVFFANTNVQLNNDPIAFIQGVLTWLRTPANPAYQTFENFPAGENSSDELEWNPTLNGQPVYNFALCRIRYRATTTVATNVRVFFRLFQTAATGTEYNSSTTYRVGGHPGVKVPLLGIQGGELVTIPFFAEARKAANVNLNQQSDTNNVQNINPAPQGAEAYMYYGCWLDINQPGDLRFPIQPSPPDGGPFTGGLQSIANLIRGTHQCMVTEINFNQEAITPQGISTASSDMLSQRNLAIDNSDNPGSLDSHRVQHTFAIHPTTSNLAPKQGPDELMIAWGNTPVGTIATIYLPGVRASEILSLAGRNSNLQTLERVDDHTVRCKTAGVTYIPIPSGGTLDLAGLITLDLPFNIHKGQTFCLVARQVMDTPAPQPRTRPPVDTPAARQKTNRATVQPKPSKARHILGAFQFSIQVQTAKEILPRDERILTALQRVIATIPLENRWYPVFHRYMSQLGDRIGALGGKPDGGKGEGPGRGHEPRGAEDRIGYEGKVCDLSFDRFGDFEGFWLDTEDGKRCFRSREREVEELVRDAWARRIAIIVIVDKEDRDDPKSIVLLRPPAGL